MDLQKEAFIKQTSAKLPLYYAQTCDDALTRLELKSGLIYFKTFYEADLSNKDAVKVTQYLAVTNVITSYSIHYTKLYDNDFSIFPELIQL